MARDGWLAAGFTIRRDRLDKARSTLGILEPVELKLTRYTNSRGTVGCLIGLRDGVWRIALDTYLTPAQASRTVYHELAHIVQANRHGGMDKLDGLHEQQLRAARLIGPGQRRFFRARATARMQLEREAEQLARRWHREFALAEPRRSG